jgi:hypothetical protein
VLPLNLLPFLRRGPRLHAKHWLYFFAIGVAREGARSAAHSFEGGR